MVSRFAYKISGLVVLLLGALFFLRDLGINYIGNTSGWTILIVLLGASLLAAGVNIKNSFNRKIKQNKNS